MSGDSAEVGRVGVKDSEKRIKRYKFTATVEPATGGGAYVLFPYDVEEEFGTKGRVPIQAKLNGVPYRGSLVKYGHPQHMLPILKAIREQTGADIGEKIQVEVWKDEQPREVEVPAEFKSAMKAHGVLAFFENLSYTHRKEYCRWISEAKKEETRARRIEKGVAMLKKRIRTPDGAAAVEGL